MADKKKTEFFEPEVSPGELYSKIIVSREEFDRGERELVKRKEPRFVEFCKSVYKRFPSLGGKAVFTPKHREAIDFLRWDLKAEEFSATAKFTMILAMALGIIAAVLLLFSPVFEIVLVAAQFDLLAYVYISVSHLKEGAVPDETIILKKEDHYEVFINAYLVKLGLAEVVEEGKSGPYGDLFLELEEEAKKNKKGLWG